MTTPWLGSVLRRCRRRVVTILMTVPLLVGLTIANVVGAPGAVHVALLTPVIVFLAGVAPRWFHADGLWPRDARRA